MDYLQGNLMSPEYDYHKRHRSHVYYESRRKRFIIAMVLIGGAIILIVTLLNLSK